MADVNIQMSLMVIRIHLLIINFRIPAGLDLGKSYRVSKAIYTPRNDVSFIYKDNIYELFYWDKGCWNSLGRQTAVADSLVYTVPQNALLYLKNHTTGNDERIFEYENGKQIFW